MDVWGSQILVVVDCFGACFWAHGWHVVGFVCPHAFPFRSSESHEQMMALLFDCVHLWVDAFLVANGFGCVVVSARARSLLHVQIHEFPKWFGFLCVDACVAILV